MLSATEEAHFATYYAVQNQTTALHFQAITLAADTGFYSLSLGSFALSTYLLFRCKRLSSRTDFVLWAVTLVMLCTSTASYILGWTLFLSPLSSYEDQLGILGDIPPGARTYFLPFSNIHVNIEAVTALVAYMPIINWLGGDVMVAWRAWVIWSRGKAVMVVLMSLLLLTTAAAIIVASTTKTQLRYVSEDILTPAWAVREIRMAHYGSIALWSCSLLTNLVSTGLIGIKVWFHRSSFRNYLQDRPVRTQSLAVLSLLLESGVLYCAVWVIYIFAQTICINDSSRTIVWDPYVGHAVCGRSMGAWYFSQLSHAVMEGVLVHISGIYPTMIVVLVFIQRSVTEFTSQSNLEFESPTQAMHFAMPNNQRSLTTHEISHSSV